MVGRLFLTISHDFRPFFPNTNSYLLVQTNKCRRKVTFFFGWTMTFGERETLYGTFFSSSFVFVIEMLKHKSIANNMDGFQWISGNDHDSFCASFYTILQASTNPQTISFSLMRRFIKQSEIKLLCFWLQLAISRSLYFSGRRSECALCKLNVLPKPSIWNPGSSGRKWKWFWKFKMHKWRTQWSFVCTAIAGRSVGLVGIIPFW